ncbi:MAG: hypothetical protein KJ674_03120 [Nanoarchaeota archaeon]|nr:hypothetical protein [Nanoarchaeota archaeon]
MDFGIYVEFYSDKKIDEIAKDKIVKGKLVFPREIVVGAKSLNEFYKYEKKIKNKIHKDVIVRYWPILKKEEGYWISFKAKTKALERIFNELKKRKNKNKFYLMIDFEDPIQKVGYDFEKNKRLIKDIFDKKSEYKLDISVVETSPFNVVERHLENEIGLNNYDIEQVKMYYSSFVRKYKFFLLNWISSFVLNKEIKRGLKKDRNYVIALGCLEVGILGDEPLMTEKNLREDLSLVKKNGLKKVMLFGYQNRYKEVLKEFI